MADFNEALLKVLSAEGMASSLDLDENTVMLCSDCFRDEGLRLEALRIGSDTQQECPNCKSVKGVKLTRANLHEICYRFFVQGTIHKTRFGGSPRVQFNPDQFGQSDIELSSWLEADLKLLEQANQIGFFYYGPRLWMIGHNEPLLALQEDNQRDAIIDQIIKSYPVREITQDHYFYRVRVNPSDPHDIAQYDSAPNEKLGTARFDEINFPVLYGSPDLELCIHECRSAAEDDLYVAKMIPTGKLKMLNLYTLIEEAGDEFTSLDIAVHFLFLASKHAYPICRALARAAEKNGFDGIIFPSYFSNVRTGAIPFETAYGISIRKIAQERAQSSSIPNVALFGRPVLNGKVEVNCINKVQISQVKYDLIFGPVLK